MDVRRHLDRVLALHVVGDDDAGDAALRLGDPHRPVNRMAHLGRVGDVDRVVGGDVLEQRHQVDLLLIGAAQPLLVLLADDREHRLVVELCVIEAVQQVDRARAGGRQAHPHLSGPLGVSAGHERGHLLVAGLDELDLIVVAIECSERRVDAVARVAVDALRSPLGEALQHEIGNGLGHARSSYPRPE